MAKQYAIYRARSMKTPKELMDAYKHNFREYNVTNADLSRRDENIELIDLNGRTYQDVVDERIEEMRIIGANRQTIRKDQVRAQELIFRYSYDPEHPIDKDEWAKETIAWIRKTFNPPDGKIHYTDPDTGEEKEHEIDNLLSAVMHNDEGVPHIHAVIIPIDDRGHLNNQYYFGGRQKLVEQQNTYAEAMKKFGLSRGEYKSTATAQQVARYLTEIHKATTASLPEPEKGEDIDHYYERATRAFQNEKIHHRDEIVKQNQENIRARSEELQRFEASHADSWENKKKLRKIAKLFGEKEVTDEMIEKIQDLIDDKRAIDKALSDSPNKEAVVSIMKQQDELIQSYKKDREKRKRKTR